MLAENIPVPSSPVPIATIDLVQSQSEVGSPVHLAGVLPVKKTKHQEDQEDVTQPAWVLSGAPWVTIAFAIFQIRDRMKISKSSGPPPEADPLQVNTKHQFIHFKFKHILISSLLNVSSFWKLDTDNGLLCKRLSQ